MDTGRVEVMNTFESGLKSMHYHHDTVVCAPVSPVISLFDIPSSRLSSTFLYVLFFILFLVFVIVIVIFFVFVSNFLCRGHSAVIYSVFIQDFLVASGDAEGSVRLWDLRINNKNNTKQINNSNSDKNGNNNCITHFKALHQDKIRSLSLCEHLLMTGSGEILFINFKIYYYYNYNIDRTNNN